MSKGRINFRTEHKEEVNRLAEEWGVDVSTIYQEITELMIRDSDFRKYTEMFLDEEIEVEEYLERITGLEDALENHEEYRDSVVKIVSGYVVGEEDLFLEGFEELDEVLQLDMARYAADALENARYQLDL